MEKVGLEPVKKFKMAKNNIIVNKNRFLLKFKK